MPAAPTPHADTPEYEVGQTYTDSHGKVWSIKYQAASIHCKCGLYQQAGEVTYLMAQGSLAFCRHALAYYMQGGE